MSLIIKETNNSVIESHPINTSFENVVDIPSKIVSSLTQDFLNKIVYNVKSIDSETIVGIGSTRSVLENLPNSKKELGDLDLIAVTNEDRKSTVGVLVSKAKAIGLDWRVAFGNVFSVAYPFEGQQYQVDLMVAEASTDNVVYNYMTKFRYWSDEATEQSTSFVLKGAHRSELTRTIIKAVGLSATESGFSEFLWNDKYSTASEIANTLCTKAQRFKDSSKKEQTITIAQMIEDKLKDVKRLKDVLADTNGFIKNRYPHSLFRNYPKGYEVLVDMLFTKVEGSDNWEPLLDKKFNLTNTIDMMRKFDDVVNLIKELLNKKILTPRSVVFSFLEMKKNFDTGKAGMKWSVELQKYIEYQFTFLKGRL